MELHVYHSNKNVQITQNKLAILLILIYALGKINNAEILPVLILNHLLMMQPVLVIQKVALFWLLQHSF
jgi:hypothetical protein